jgi:hypothetical protein
VVDFGPRRVVECLEFRVFHSTEFANGTQLIDPPTIWGTTKHCADGPRALKNLGSEPLSFQLRRNDYPDDAQSVRGCLFGPYRMAVQGLKRAY